MEIEIGKGKKGRRGYGFDDIAIVPSRRTRDPDDGDVSWTLGPYRLELPQRRRRERPLPGRARPRRRGRVLTARPLPFRAADARGGDGRGGVPADRRPR